MTITNGLNGEWLRNDSPYCGIRFFCIGMHMYGETMFMYTYIGRMTWRFHLTEKTRSTSVRVKCETSAWLTRSESKKTPMNLDAADTTTSHPECTTFDCCFHETMAQIFSSNRLHRYSAILLMLGVVASTGRAFTTPIVVRATSASSSFPKHTTSSRRMISSILDLLGGPDKSALISPEKALPGRSTKMPNIEGLRHYILGNKLDEVPDGHKVAVFANGVRITYILTDCRSNG